MTNLSSSNVAHDIYCNYLQCLSKKLTFFGPPQLKSLKYLAMCWQAIHISLRRNMIFVVFRMLLLCLLLFLLLLLHWPQYHPTQLRCKMVEFETLTQSQMVRHALSLHWTSFTTLWRPLIHGRVNWWWCIHVKLIWKKWNCRILKICYIRIILWVGKFGEFWKFGFVGYW